MKTLNETTTAIFISLIKMAEENNGHFKLDNNRSYIPLVIEKIEEDIISLAHYGELNGDLMADPEMTFLIRDQKIFPMSYTNHYAGASRQYAWKDPDGTIKYLKQSQASAVEFAEMWLNNIKEQQNLAA